MLFEFEFDLICLLLFPSSVATLPQTRLHGGYFYTQWRVGQLSSHMKVTGGGGGLLVVEDGESVCSVIGRSFALDIVRWWVFLVCFNCLDDELRCTFNGCGGAINLIKEHLALLKNVAWKTRASIDRKNDWSLSLSEQSKPYLRDSPHFCCPAHLLACVSPISSIHSWRGWFIIEGDWLATCRNLLRWREGQTAFV